MSVFYKNMKSIFTLLVAVIYMCASRAVLNFFKLHIFRFTEKFNDMNLLSALFQNKL